MLFLSLILLPSHFCEFFHINIEKKKILRKKILTHTLQLNVNCKLVIFETVIYHILIIRDQFDA